ncbi:hypothetical protein SBRY_90098 [Actinacidiphila bryophytorum]|uniref:Uncharacterized protein n=1 Tax=Actinacidiphila bryophytorum TaxID=1436133 RepID=A0A9W4H8D7_9ACTN|nr:hypothetical protein SBRY_90098 [Actinacidiphila bryophytorum]
MLLGVPAASGLPAQPTAVVTSNAARPIPAKLRIGVLPAQDAVTPGDWKSTLPPAAACRIPSGALRVMGAGCVAVPEAPRQCGLPGTLRWMGTYIALYDDAWSGATAFVDAVQGSLSYRQDDVLRHLAGGLSVVGQLSCRTLLLGSRPQGKFRRGHTRSHVVGHGTRPRRRLSGARGWGGEVALG